MRVATAFAILLCTCLFFLPTRMLYQKNRPAAAVISCCFCILAHIPVIFFLSCLKLYNMVHEAK